MKYEIQVTFKDKPASFQAIYKCFNYEWKVIGNISMLVIHQGLRHCYLPADQIAAIWILEDE